MLPLTRNTTYTAGSPIKSADLNDLQDCVVGRKHGSSPQFIPAAAFQLEVPGATLSVGMWVGSGTVIAAIPGLAVGDVIDRIDWCYNRAGAGSIFRRVKALNIATGVGIADPWAPAVIAAGAAYVVQSDLLAYTVPADTGVWLWWQQDNAANNFAGAYVWTTRP